MKRPHFYVNESQKYGNAFKFYEKNKRENLKSGERFKKVER